MKQWKCHVMDSTHHLKHSSFMNFRLGIWAGQWVCCQQLVSITFSSNIYIIISLPTHLGTDHYKCSQKCRFVNKTLIRSSTTFFSIWSSKVCSNCEIKGPLQLEYNIRSLIGHLYPGIEYMNTESKRIHLIKAKPSSCTVCSVII